MIRYDVINSIFRCAIFAAGCFALSGCGDFFEKKPTEIESKSIINEISRIRENPHVYNPLPEMYRTPPKRLALADGVKMFYYTKHHPAAEIAADLKNLGFDLVSQNASTNQVIIHAASDEECDTIEKYLSKTDVPPIQVHIDCIILERFGDITQDWETTILIENLFGEQITLGEDKFPGPAFPGASIRERQRSTFGLDFGIWKNEGIPGHQIRAAVDILESRGYLKILLNPTLETVNGKEAMVQIRDRAPIEVTVTEKDRIYKLTKYEWVADTLKITPSVYADGFIGLKTSIVIGSKSKPEGVVQTPILTQRSIDVAENRIEPGKSLIIGGMRRSENRSVVRGVPFFKDLPLIGAFFSSKDFEETGTEIVYILTPSISSGSVEYSTIADSLRKKYKGFSDRAELETYTQFVEQKSAQAAMETVRLQRDVKRAEFQAREERLRGERAMLESKILQAQADQAKAQYEQSVAQINAAEAQAEAAAKEAQAQQAFISQTTEEIQKAAAVAAAAVAAAQKANAEFEQARQKTQKAQAEAEKVKAQYDALQAEIEKINQAQQQEQQAPAAKE